ncbi:MAG: hypothetical protein IJ055_05305 [Oscillospiraceae bacterium]|nr:hypothetical protein [Oscillospiraceae bacterium]
MNRQKRTAAACAMVMAMAACCALSAPPAAAAGEQQAVTALVNAERARQGLPALREEAVLDRAAEQRAQEIVQQFSHTRPDGSSCFTVLEEYGVLYRSAGENIAYGYTSPESVMDGWMNSPGHRANILSGQYDSIGIGVFEYGGTTYWTQVFTGGAVLPEETPVTQPGTQPNTQPNTQPVTQPVTQPPAQNADAPCIGESCTAQESCIPDSLLAALSACRDGQSTGCLKDVIALGKCGDLPAALNVMQLLCGK